MSFCLFHSVYFILSISFCLFHSVYFILSMSLTNKSFCLKFILSKNKALCLK